MIITQAVSLRTSVVVPGSADVPSALSAQRELSKLVLPQDLSVLRPLTDRTSALQSQYKVLSLTTLIQSQGVAHAPSLSIILSDLHCLRCRVCSDAEPDTRATKLSCAGRRRLCHSQLSL